MSANDSGYMKQSVVDAKADRQSAKRSSVSKKESSGSELSRMKREFSMFRRDTEIEMEELSRNIKNSGGSGQTGASGADGKDGVGISSVEQTVQSDADGGENVVTITL